MDGGRVQRGIASLKQLPVPDILASSLPEGYVCLIADDGTDLTPSLANALAYREWKVVILSYSAFSDREEVNVPRVFLEEMGEEYLQKKLDEVSATFGPIGAVIYLNPPQNTGILHSFIEPEIPGAREKLIC